MIPDFPHKDFPGYSFEFEKFNAKFIRVMLRHSQTYTYNGGESVATVWGFYDPKKKEYYAPVNATKVGKKVNIKDTRAYTSMPIHLTILESCFQ